MTRLIDGIHEFPAIAKAYAQAMRAAQKNNCGACQEDEIHAKYTQMLAAKRQERRRVAAVKVRYPGIHK